MIGTVKMKPLVIGKSKFPDLLKGLKIYQLNIPTPMLG
jgi:hypothetical protein